jgi:hypothetical protein
MSTRELFDADKVEETTSPDALARHPGNEGNGNPPPRLDSLPPDADLRMVVQQLLGGHTQLRGQVGNLQTDVRTLIQEQRTRAKAQDEQHENSLHRMTRIAASSPIALVVVAIAQWYLTHAGVLPGVAH